MEANSINIIIAAVVAIAVATFMTWLVRGIATKLGYVAKPKADRWHSRSTAMMGGVAIFATTVLMYFVFVPPTRESLTIIGASSLLFFVGLIDDLLNIKPYQKLIGQLIGASIIVGMDMVLPLTGSELLDVSITVFWLVGITNAVNLLDNMDGLAAGIAAIAGASLALGFAANGQFAEATFIAIFVGALVGFLVFNFNPASIFMGDCGSMFVGFLLASSVLLSNTGGRSRGVFSILAVPVLILFVPIFDTTFVAILRKLWGRKASQGGRDHTSHRLVALGLSERSAVLMIYAFAIAAGLLSLMVSNLRVTQSLALIVFFTIILTIVGVYLSKVKVYDDKEVDLAKRNNAVFAFIIDVSYKRRIFEVFLDVLLISLSYYASYVLLFGSFEGSSNWELFINTLPMLVVIKLFAFLAMGVYRGLWRYTSVSDLITFVKGVGLACVLSVLAVLLIYRFEGFSRAVFILDGVLLLFAVVGSRLAFRMIRELLPPTHSRDGRRVLIYGAGDGGEMVLRELQNNPEWGLRPIAFIDDDRLKKDKIIKGLKVFIADNDLSKLCNEMEIDEVLISFRENDTEKIAEIKEICNDLNVGLKRALLKIENVGFE